MSRVLEPVRFQPQLVGEESSTENAAVLQENLRNIRIQPSVRPPIGNAMRHSLVPQSFWKVLVACFVEVRVKVSSHDLSDVRLRRAALDAVKLSNELNSWAPRLPGKGDS